MLLGTIVTAFFIPNMLRKGTVDLLVTKPVHRWTLLVFKFIGGLSFMFLTTAAVVIGVWLAFGLRTGLWSHGFLLSIFVLTLQFAIFYSVSTLLGVVTRSPIVAILGTIAFWGLLALLAVAMFFIRPFHEAEATPPWVFTSVQTVRKVLPRYHELDTLTSRLIAHNLLSEKDQDRRDIDKEAERINWGESLGVTFAFIAVMLGLACWWFTRKDY
jgi:ABC-type transport system involved in multi-copper enzyme maturation permease subunit